MWKKCANDMQNCVQMKESKCAKDILKWANDKCYAVSVDRRKHMFILFCFQKYHLVEHWKTVVDSRDVCSQCGGDSLQPSYHPASRRLISGIPDQLVCFFRGSETRIHACGMCLNELRFNEWINFLMAITNEIMTINLKINEIKCKPIKLSRDMRFPTMYYFDKNRLRRTCAASF